MRCFNSLTAAAAAAVLSVLAAGDALAQKTLSVGMAAADVGQLDPHKATTTQDKPVVSWIFNGLVRLKPGSAKLEDIEPDLAEQWDSVRRQARMDLQSAQGREIPRQLRRAHRRRRGVLAAARRQLQDLLVLGRLRERRQDRGGRPADGAHHVEKPDSVAARHRRQLPRRQHRLEEGGRGTRRQLPHQSDRHRAIRVRRLQAERERDARRPCRLLPWQAEDRADRLSLHPVGQLARLGLRRPASSTCSTAARTSSGSTA